MDKKLELADQGELVIWMASDDRKSLLTQTSKLLRSLGSKVEDTWLCGMQLARQILNA